MNPEPLYQWKMFEPIGVEDLNRLSKYPCPLPQLLVNRGIRDIDTAEQFLNSQGSIYDPFLMKGMEQAVERLFNAIDHDLPIAVYGDYDADGVTASAILTQVLKKYGKSELIRSYIPNRFEEGYGLNKNALRKLYEDGVRLVITVDCGIRSFDEALLAKELGLGLIISDHHEPAETIPEAEIVVCPKVPGDLYPEKNLAGVGIAFKIAQALITRRPPVGCEAKDWLDLLAIGTVAGCEAKDWLDLLAIGTVADIVPLTGENRSLVKAGLNRLKNNPCLAVQALAEVGRFKISEIDSETIGFGIGPRLNASGRLDSAALSYNLLMSRSLNEARDLAGKVNDKNNERKDKTKRIGEAAEQSIDANHVPAVIFVRGDEETYNAGIVGLAASRVTEKYYRPSVVGSRGETETRASCRSIPEFNIIEALDQYPELMIKYGGHAMAAGLTVKNEDWDTLKEAINAVAEERFAEVFKDGEIKAVKKAEMELSLEYLDMDFYRQVCLLEPYGQDNPKPLFLIREAHPEVVKLLGPDRSHLKLVFRGKHKAAVEAVGWGMGEKWGKTLESLPAVDLLCELGVNTFRGVTALQLQLVDIRLSGG